MPIAIDPNELAIITGEAKSSFDPEIHGRHDLSAMPKYPIDDWFDSSAKGPHLSELTNSQSIHEEAAFLYYTTAELLIPVLSPTEQKIYLEAWSYIAGLNPENRETLNDYWVPNEIGSLFIWYAYSPETCAKAASSIKAARFIDLLQKTHERNFTAWGTDKQVFNDNDFWRILRGDLDFSSGIHSIQAFETTTLTYLNYCARNNKALIQEHWGI